MRILITGATGLVGSSIVKLCHENNIAVNFLTTSKESIRKKDNYTGYYWNPEEGLIDPECFQGVSAVINLAGASISKRWTKRRKEAILSSRINSIRTLGKGLERLGTSSITTFVSASGTGIYPDSLSSYYSEDAKGTDDSFLGEVVYAWEKEADTLSKFGLKVAKVRIGLVLSTEGGALPEMAKPVNNYVGAAFGSGEQWQSWIHIRDLARLFLFIIDNDLQGVYNGVAPNPVTNEKLINEIARVLEKPLLLPNIPRFMMDLVLGEMASILFTSQRVSCRKIENEGFVFQFPNISRALQDLFTPAKNESTETGSLRNEFADWPR